MAINASDFRTKGAALIPRDILSNVRLQYLKSAIARNVTNVKNFGRCQRFFTVLVAIAVFVPFYAVGLFAGDTFPINPRSLASVGYLALFPSVVAFICWNHAVPLVGPNVAAFFYPMAPVFASFSAIIVLGEQLHAYHLAGFALVLAGLFLVPER